MISALALTSRRRAIAAAASAVAAMALAVAVTVVTGVDYVVRAVVMRTTSDRAAEKRARKEQG